MRLGSTGGEMASRGTRRNWIVLLMSAAACLAAVGFWRYYATPPKPNPEPAPQSQPRSSAVAEPLPLELWRDEYVSSRACLKCHPEQHKTWQNSYHRTMTQVAGPQSVVPSFDNVHLESRDRTYDLERRGDEFWVTMAYPQQEFERMSGAIKLPPGSSLPVAAQKVVMTTGSHVAQTYWVTEGKELWQVPWIYHIEEQQWVPNNDSFLLPPDTGHLLHKWNTNCVKCHASGPIPGWTAEAGYRTRVAELGIACEACHGPGEAHIRYREPTAAKDPQSTPSLDKDPIVNPARCSPLLASQICAQCHSNHTEGDLVDWVNHGSRYRPGEDLEQKVRMHRFNTPDAKAEYGQGYWDDGTCRTGGDEYLGLVASKCYEGGKLSCLNCHSMHNYTSNSLQLKPQMEGNQACFACHEDLRDKLEQHTHHASGSSGSDCLNCHMPHIVYALFKGIRSHRIDSPSAAVTAKTGRPNACNLCHLDKPLGWAADNLTKWYGQPPVELTEQQKTTSAAVSMALQGDAADRVIAAWHLGWEPARRASRDDWQTPYLAYLLDDPYAVVRYVSFRSLKKQPGFDKQTTFDFTPPSNQKPSFKNQALEIWLSQSKSRQPFGAAGPAILLSDDGQLHSATVEVLLRKRDNRRITILE
ncbi:MAG: cytochrome c3 family protein [Pirellulaceae bacterium]